MRFTNWAQLYSALADLEDKEGHKESAVRFEQTALRYKYQAIQPESCGSSHNNLSNYIERSEGGEPDAVLAHRLAASVLRLQTSSGSLYINVANLARSPLPPAPPSFEQVCEIVEQIEGVRFREMFDQLPKRAPDGDAAIQAVWQMVMDEAKGIKDKVAQVEALLAALPEAVREALLSEDEERIAAAFEKLTPEQQQVMIDVLGSE